MSITFNKNAMLAVWRTGLGYTPFKVSGSCERFDGVDLDTYLEGRMYHWYVDLLYNMPLAYMPMTDITDRLKIEVEPDGEAYASLPDGVIAIGTVVMEGWERQARITSDPAHPAIEACRNPFARPAGSWPLVLHHDGRLIFPGRDVSTGSKFTRVTALLLPPEDTDTNVFTPWMRAQLNKYFDANRHEIY